MDPKRIELFTVCLQSNLAHLGTCEPIKMPKNRQVQKVGIEPTSSPPQTVPSTADLLLDNKTSLYMMSMAEARFELATSRL